MNKNYMINNITVFRYRSTSTRPFLNQSQEIYYICYSDVMTLWLRQYCISKQTINSDKNSEKF